MEFTIDNDAPVENPGILVKLPPVIIIPGSSMFRALQLAFQKSDTPASQIVMKRVRQTNRLILNQSPTGMKSTNVIG